MGGVHRELRIWKVNTPHPIHKILRFWKPNTRSELSGHTQQITNTLFFQRPPKARSPGFPSPCVARNSLAFRAAKEICPTAIKQERKFCIVMAGVCEWRNAVAKLDSMPSTSFFITARKPIASALSAGSLCLHSSANIRTRSSISPLGSVSALNSLIASRNASLDFLCGR